MDNQEVLLQVLSMILSNGTKPEKVGSAPATLIDKGRYIVIGNRGNVVVGDLAISGSAGYMKNASVIRVWGTSKGLGQLALEGATSKTILDPCGEFEFDVLTTCGMIPVKSNF